MQEPIFFPRGAILPGGRLDACKQGLGPGGCQSLALALEARVLEGCPDIRAILLGTGAIGDEGAQAVAQLIRRSPNLETIYLGCNGITARGVQVLADAIEQSPGVRGLWLKRNPIGSEGVARLAQMLRRSRLSTLDIVNCGFEPSALSPLSHVLEHENRALRRLYVGGNGLGPAQARELARVLEASAGLEALLLNASHLGDEGVHLLARGLSLNASLRELGLGSNGLSGRGVAFLGEAVARHCALESLDLSRSSSQSALQAPPNILGEEGARHVASMLGESRALRRLSLRGTGIERAGAEQIFQAACTHPALSELQLDLPLPEAVRRNLQRNRDSRGQWIQADEVSAIRSVYRSTKPKDSGATTAST